MITTIAVILTLILCCAAFGKMQGEGDYREIERRKQIPFSKDLDHGPLWLVRAGVCSVFIGTAMLVMRIWGPPPTPMDWLDLLYFYGVAYGSFTSVHRLTLNKARGLDWRYVASGNAYDRLFMLLFDRIPGRLQFTGIVKLVHRAGAFEYAFEALILLGGAALLLFANN